MKKAFLRKIAIVLLPALLLCLSACGREAVYREISLGAGLPDWQFAEERYAAALADDAENPGLVGNYQTGRESDADVLLYRFAKEPGMTLESVGQELAAEYNVFCNMTTFADCPAANVTYCEAAGDEDYLVRAYILEGRDEFVKVCFRHHTQKLPLGESDFALSMPAGSTVLPERAGVFPFETVYSFEDEALPTVMVRQFAKDYFTAESFDALLCPGTSAAQYARYAENGWTQQEIIDIYDENFSLLKGELIHRNGFDAAFIGYIDEGIFYVRAFLDCGDDYIVLCAENDANIFQHVVNALIDTIDTIDTIDMPTR